MIIKHCRRVKHLATKLTHVRLELRAQFVASSHVHDKRGLVAIHLVATLLLTAKPAAGARMLLQVLRQTVETIECSITAGLSARVRHEAFMLTLVRLQAMLHQEAHVAYVALKAGRSWLGRHTL